MYELFRRARFRICYKVYLVPIQPHHLDLIRHVMRILKIAEKTTYIE
jgi:hypothetical protein